MKTTPVVNINPAIAANNVFINIRGRIGFSGGTAFWTWMIPAEDRASIILSSS